MLSNYALEEKTGMGIFDFLSPRFDTATISKQGGRTKNEDALKFKTDKNWGCWVLADGLGGHCGGEIASQIAVNSILESFLADQELAVQSLGKHISTAQQEILMKQGISPDLRTIHTTVVVLLCDSKSFIWGYVGDSRFYLFRSGKIVLQSEDHSLSQAMVIAGEIKPNELRHHEDRNILLRALGKKGNLRPGLADGKSPWQRGDVFLLCTDGFWENITEEEMERELALNKTPRKWLTSMEKIILERVHGNYDNYTAIAVYIS